MRQLTVFSSALLHRRLVHRDIRPNLAPSRTIVWSVCECGGNHVIINNCYDAPFGATADGRILPIHSLENLIASGRLNSSNNVDRLPNAELKLRSEAEAIFYDTVRTAGISITINENQSSLDGKDRSLKYLRFDQLQTWNPDFAIEVTPELGTMLKPNVPCKFLDEDPQFIQWQTAVEQQIEQGDYTNWHHPRTGQTNLHRN